MEQWINMLLKGLDEYTDEDEKQKIMKQCGTKCPYSHMPDEKVKELKEQFNSEDELIKYLMENWRLKQEHGSYYVVFDKCYCPFVNKELEKASPTMCYCTLGSLINKFCVGLDREVEVKIISTIIRGGKECRFEIKI